jgi:hypothetical protein
MSVHLLSPESTGLPGGRRGEPREAPLAQVDAAGRLSLFNSSAKIAAFNPSEKVPSHGFDKKTVNSLRQCDDATSSHRGCAASVVALDSSRIPRLPPRDAGRLSLHETLIGEPAVT